MIDWKQEKVGYRNEKEENFRGRYFKKIRYPIVVILTLGIGILLCNYSQKEPVLKEETQENTLAIYVDDKIATEIPSKTSGYYLDLSKSNCNNNVNLAWDYYNWAAQLSFTDYNTENSQRTKCTLNFKKCNIPSNIT